MALSKGQKRMISLLVGILVVAVLAYAIIFLVRHYKHKSGYRRTCLSGDTQVKRTPVDYALKHPYGWQRNPHWQARPSDERQPLEYGPIDFHQDARKLDNRDGVLFQQYGNWWQGCGDHSSEFLINDEKGRFDLTTVGDHHPRRLLDDMYDKRFGPKGVNNVELTYDEPAPFDEIYGGQNWIPSNLGD